VLEVGVLPRISVGAVLLAAGEARRMGGRPKSLLQLDGTPLIRRNLLALSGAGVREIAVVLGHRADLVEPVLSNLPIRDRPVKVVLNADYRLGQMASLNAGLAALPESLDAIIVALADQPLIETSDIAALISAYEQHRGAASAVVPHVDGQRGNPVILGAAVRAAVLGAQIYSGCRQWLDAHPELIVRMETTSRHFCVDIDSPEDVDAFAVTYGRTLEWPAGVAA
jgi:molybdenum cofactor cytidylyltransferase